MNHIDIDDQISVPFCFHNRKYDNHLLYAVHLGYNVKQLYKLSKSIIEKKGDCFFGEAYNLSYTDIYDFCQKKQSLKKMFVKYLEGYKGGK